MAKLVDIDILAKFKEKQDTANANKFMQATDFVDGEGKIKAEKISVTSGIEIIKMHVDASDAENVKYFEDNNGVEGENEIAGESAKFISIWRQAAKSFTPATAKIFSRSFLKLQPNLTLKICLTNNFQTL